MKPSEILELIRAGYTKAEIDAMQNDAEKIEHPEPKPEPKPEPSPEPAPDPEPSPEPTPEPKESETEKLLSALGLKFDNLTAAIQNANVNNIEHGGNQGMTADDVIRSIIDGTNGGATNAR